MHFPNGSRAAKALRGTALAAAIVLVTGLAAAPGLAQPRGARRPVDADTILNWLDRQLSLTEEQQRALRPIAEEHLERLRALRAENRGEDVDREALRKQLFEVREEFQVRVEAELDEEQVEKYREARARRPQRGPRARRGPGKAPAPGGGEPDAEP
jgi:hypothetical protein